MNDSEERIRINAPACRLIAEILRSHGVPEDREETELPHIPRHLIGNFYFYIVGICHQTSPRGCPPVEGTIGGHRRVGWDFLWAKFEQACRQESDNLSPERWAKTTPNSLRALFTDESLGFRLSDIDGRVSLIRDLGNGLLSQHATSVQAMFERCGGSACSGDQNLLSELSRFEAYKDPVQKKSIFFLSLMQNTGIWKLSDPHLLEAPVDYHEVRGHLRIGTIEILDRRLSELLRHHQDVSPEADIAIRLATRKAIRTISDAAEITPSQAHYLFWNLFRGVCTREEPKCLSRVQRRSVPDRYQHLVRRGCPFEQRCAAFGSKTFPIEHQTITQYY